MEDRRSEFIVTNFGVLSLKTRLCSIRFDVVMTTLIQIEAFRVVTPFGLVDLVDIHGIMIKNTKMLLIIAGFVVFIHRPEF
jgi:hypothetical protein